MKTKSLNYSHSLLALIIALVLTSCSNPERDFKKAEQANTEEAFNEFIQKHPDSPFVSQAKTRIESNAFEKAKRTRTAAAYEGFLKQFPASPLAKQAITNMAAVAFEETTRAGTIAAYEMFLKQFPAAEDAVKAKSRLESMEFDLAANSPSITNWQSFLEKYPQSSHVESANAQLAELVLKEVHRLGTRTEYESFLSRFGSTPAANEAKQRLTRLEYEAAVGDDTIESLQKFLDRFPEAEYAGAVKKRLAIHLEERHWNQTLLTNTPQAYVDFWKRYPTTTRLKAVTGTLEAGLRIDNWRLKAIVLSLKESPEFHEEVSVKEAARLAVIVSKSLTGGTSDTKDSSDSAGERREGYIDYDPATHEAVLVEIKPPMPNSRVLLRREGTEFKVVAVDTEGQDDEVIRVPSAEEMAKGAKITIIKASEVQSVRVGEAETIGKTGEPRASEADIIRVPSAEEMKKGAKIQVIKGAVTNKIDHP